MAKKRCKPLLEKLHSIQTMQRKGYSLKRGQSLRGKEDKARNKWWKCENSSLAKFKAQYGGAKKKPTKKSNKKMKKRKSTSYVNVLSNRSKVKKRIVNSATMKTAFNQHSAIVIKSKFQGGKQTAWLQFYQKPTKCKRPKSLSVFAYCNEDKLQQQSKFDQKFSQ